MKKETNVSAIETVDTVSVENVVKFEVGKVYYFEGIPTHFIGEDICPYEVIKRTAKSVTLKYLGLEEAPTRHKIEEIGGKENVKVDGWTLKASNVLSEERLENYLKAQEIIEEKMMKFIKRTSAKAESEEAQEVAIEAEIENAVSEEVEADEERKIAVTNQKDEIYYLAVMDFGVHSGAIVDERSNIIGEYADDETAGKVIEELEAAYERGDKTFVMPEEKVQVNSEITDAAIAEISTSELENQLKELQEKICTEEDHKEFARVQIKAEWKIIMQFVSNIMRHENEIAELNALYCDAEKELSELEETAAKIKAEIHNRQFKASELMTAVMTEKEMEVAPITFDIQQFNEVVNAESAETIDTAVSKTEIPYVDEDAEEDLFEEYYALDAEVDELHKKFFEKRKALEETKRKLKDILEKKFKATKEKFYKMVEKAGDDDATIDLYAPSGKSERIAGGEWGNLAIYMDFANYPEYVITDRFVHIAEYRTLDAVKGAVDKLAAAIERGDTEFTFPADK